MPRLSRTGRLVAAPTLFAGGILVTNVGKRSIRASRLRRRPKPPSAGQAGRVRPGTKQPKILFTKSARARIKTAHVLRPKPPVLPSLASEAGVATGVGIIPPGIASSKYLEARKKMMTKRPGNPVRRPKDVLDVSVSRVSNKNFAEDPNRGISIYRPEIISLLRFKPIYLGNPKLRNFSSHGRLVEVQYQAGYLRESVIRKFLAEIIKLRGEDEVREILKSLRKKTGKEVGKIERVVDFYVSTQEIVEAMKDSFNPKKLQQGKIETNEFLSLKEFFTQIMEFTEEQYESFSNTKILSQLLFDLKSVAENYSTNLFNYENADRRRDDNPVEVVDKYRFKDFTVEKLRSDRRPRNATQASFFNEDFLDALPKGLDARVRILVSILSKEYRVSRELGDVNTQSKLRNFFEADPTGNPFDNIIGLPRGSIFDQSLGRNSLSDLMLMTVEGEVQTIDDQDRSFFVLPFEQKYVDSGEKDAATYVPGSTFFVDSIFDLKTERGGSTTFNTEPMKNYSTLFRDRERRARDLMRRFFTFNKETDLNPHAMYDQFLLSHKACISGLPQGGTLDREEATITALFKLAQKDNHLKRALFNYLIFVGLGTNEDLNEKSFWVEVARELADVRRIRPYGKSLLREKGVKAALELGRIDTNLLDGPQNLTPFIDQMAEKLARRARNLVVPVLGATGKRSRAILPEKETRVSQKYLDQKGVFYGKANKEKIKKVLDKATEGPYPNAVKEFLSLVDKFSRAASKKGARDYLLDDETGRTRFNFLSPTTQLLMIFEIMCCLIERYSFTDFRRIRHQMYIVSDQNQNDKIRFFIDEAVAKSAKKATKDLYYDLLETQDVRELLARRGPPGRRPGGRPQVHGAVYRSSDQLRNQAKASNFLEFKAFFSLAEKNYSGDLNRKFSRLRNSIRSNKARLETENLIIENMVYLLGEVSSELRTAKKLALQKFSTKNYQKWESIIQNVESLRDLQDPATLMLSSFLLDKLKNQIGSDVWVKNIVRRPTKNALYSYLAKDFFGRNQAGDKVKIISVGVPSGFSKASIERIDSNRITRNSFVEKQTDVITINVHKRDYRFEEFVFKPKKFIFDLSLFQREEEVEKIKLNSRKDFSAFQRETRVLDYLDTDKKTFYGYGQSVKNANVKSILDDQKYNFLTRNQRKRLINNHFKSFLLETYIHLSTGFRIDESTFIIDKADIAEEPLEPEFVELVNSYLINVLEEPIAANQSFEATLSSEQVSEEAKGLVRMVSYGNIYFNPEKEWGRILRPKMFQRVFHLPINIDSFEIDRKATWRKTGGREAWEQAKIEKLITKVEKEGQPRRFFMERAKGEIVFEDYFVTIKNEL